MKYKVGDKVRIVSKRKGSLWNDEGLMDKWLGKIMTISYCDGDIYGGYYQMKEDCDEHGGRGWYWHEHMIECKVEDENKETNIEYLLDYVQMNKYQEAFENIFPTKDWKYKFPQFVSVTQMMEMKREDYEALKELVEKATQKKVKNRVYRGTVVRQISNETPFSYDLIDGKCPCCGYKCGNTDEYCRKCGQALDWE